MLEYRLEPEGGLLVCALGTLEVGGGQIVECSLCLSDILPERRVALAVELLEGDAARAALSGIGTVMVSRTGTSITETFDLSSPGTALAVSS